jgi:hypothetical protein
MDPGSHVGISNQHKKHKSGRGPSNEHFWHVWLKSYLTVKGKQVRPNKYICVFTVTCQKNLGSVGQDKFFIFSSPGHSRPGELLSWVSVRHPSVSFSHLNLLL